MNFDEVQKLKQQLEEANAVITYYGNKDNWTRSNKTHFTRINCMDVEQSEAPYKRLGYEYWHIEIGGKRARNYKNKWNVV